ncbi:MAG: phosphatidylinositol kinase [Thiotrichales bacterium]|nr:MAG: phosphatidylinositol kinase [Thiotrichales bacterium]
MNFSNVTIVNVHFIHGTNKLSVGRLALKDRKIFFEYDPEFIKTDLQLSPFKLPLKPNVQVGDNTIFDGLFGVFNDSLPDGWGHLLLDRKLMQLGINPGQLSPLDRLRYVGSSGMGALIYEPEIKDDAFLHNKDLDEIANETLQFQENHDVEFVDDLLARNGSSSGVRPKIVVSVNNEDWLIKFRATTDPKDISAIEYAYHLMAKDAGLIVPRAKLFPSKKGLGYFGVKRFDRYEEGRLHIHTISGLLHTSHHLPNLDYEIIMRTTALLTRDTRECEKQFRAAVFNVLSHNRDDHAKNFSFVMDTQGIWNLSPAYDLTFSSGPAGEHSSTIMGEGKNPKLAHLLRLAEVASMQQKKALQIIEEVKSAVSKWKIFAKTAGVTSASCEMIQKAINRIGKDMVT